MNNRFAIILIFFLSGCVSVDSQSWKEEIDIDRTKSLSGVFSNYAAYKSTGEFVAIGNFSELFRAGQNKARTVTITLKNSDLDIKFSDSEKVFKYNFDNGLRINDDGKLQISMNEAHSGEGAIGYSHRTVTLFINKKGHLVTIQSGSTGGFFGPTPLAIYAKHVAIFNIINN